MSYESLTREQLIAILRRRDAQARYGLVWERKDIAPDAALNNDFVSLRLDEGLSCGEGPWDNLLIEGDNYDALRLLASTMAGRFQLIYIDPPYNTGRRDFVYNDRFFDAADRFRHSTWLEFMYQRLMLARELLAEDGAIFVSIDDNEVFNLGLLMNQVFGEKAFVANCVWQKRYSRENVSSIGTVHEYLLVFSPNPDAFKKRRGRLPLDERSRSYYKNPNNDPQGPWRLIPMNAPGIRPNQQYPVTTPSGRVIYPPEGRHWSVLEGEFERLRAEGRISFGPRGDSAPGLIRYLSEVEGLVPWTFWPHEEVGHTDEARKEIQEIFGTQTAFDTPKPLRLMERVLAIGAPEKDALVLDFFAGSGTLGHAVLAANQKDGGSRRFVLVSSREATVDEPDKNLARDVCGQRLRKAVEGYQSRRGAMVPGLGGSFAHMQARRVPMHRLEDELDDSLVWSYALQMAGHPHCAVQPPVSVSRHAGRLVAYCANTRPSTLRRLAEVVGAHSGRCAVFTWAPAAVSEALHTVDASVTVVSVPGDLRRTFKQGRSMSQSPDDPGLPSARTDVVEQGGQT